MCGRFCIAASPGEIMERYNVSVPSDYAPRYNISPGSRILCITYTSDGYEGRMCDWGINPGSSHRVMNARVETVRDKPLFKNAFENNRCIIPASGFYEWKHNKTQKSPYYFISRAQPILSFAGLIRISPEGEEAAVITTRAVPPYTEIHDRMPVILEPEGERAYLIEGKIEEFTHLLDFYEISPRINHTDTEGPDLIKPHQSKRGQMTLTEI